MEVLLIRSMLFRAAQATQNVVAIGIHGSSAFCGVARQHWVKTRQGSQGLPAEMRYRDCQRLETGEVFMLIVLANFCNFASQIGRKLAQAREIFADVYR